MRGLPRRRMWCTSRQRRGPTSLDATPGRCPHHPQPLPFPPLPTRGRRTLLFVLSVSPVLALVALLAWGQVRSGGALGGPLVHERWSETAPVGRAAPGLVGIDLLSGGPVDLDALGGSVVVVDFWSSWCVACRREAEDLAAVHREYAGSGVAFVGVAIWDRTGDAVRHLERYGVGYPNVLDGDGQLAVRYGVRGVPEKYVIDREGNIVHKMNGPVSHARLREVIDALVAS